MAIGFYRDYAIMWSESGCSMRKTNELKERIKENKARRWLRIACIKFLELKVENEPWMPSCSFRPCQEMVSA